MKAEFAWPGGDRPGSSSFGEAVPAHIVQQLKSALPTWLLNGMSVVRSLGKSTDLAGRYRVSCSNCDYFVRVSRRIGDPDLESSIIDHLAKHDVRVNTILEFALFESKNNESFRIDIREFIPGQHFCADLHDLEPVGACLAKAHQALRDFNQREKVREIASMRMQRLQEIRDELLAKSTKHDFDAFEPYVTWLNQHGDQFLAALMDVSPMSLLERTDSQVVHGELHQANVLFTDSDVYMLDFEESVHLFMPPTWDIAFVIQRFCWDEHARVYEPMLVERFLKGYGDHDLALHAMMQVIGVISILTIIDLYRNQGIVSPPSELYKFDNLIARNYL